MCWEHSPGWTNRGSPEHSHRGTVPAIHFTGTIKAPLNLNSPDGKTAARACRCCRQQHGRWGLTSLGLWGWGATVSAKSRDCCLSRRPRGFGMLAPLPHPYLLGPTSPASQPPALPGWQGVPCTSAEELRHLNGRHPHRPRTLCRTQVPLPRDSNSCQTAQAAREETLQRPTAALVNHLFGLQLNFCSPCVTLPVPLQDGHNTALIRPPDRMRPWEDKQQARRYFPLRFPDSRCRAGL